MKMREEELLEEVMENIKYSSTGMTGFERSIALLVWILVKYVGRYIKYKLPLGFLGYD